MMTSVNDSVNLVFVNLESLKKFLLSAQKKVIFAKTSYFKEEIEVLIALVKSKNVRCELYFESDDKTVRYGFGDTDALKLIRASKELFTIKFVKNIRMAMLIVDDRTLSYTPTALSWEEEPEETSFPNGIIFGSEMTEKIIDQMQFKNDTGANSDISFLSPPRTKIFDQGTKTDRKLDKTIENLEKNPAVDPASLRKVTAYRNAFKIIRKEVRGVKIERKSVNLNPFKKYLSGAVGTERLKSSWTVITNDDAKNIDFFKDFEAKFENLFGQLTISAGRFGALIMTDKMRELESKINEYRDSFINSLKTESNSSSLTCVLNKSRYELIDYLYLSLENDKKSMEKILDYNEPIKKRVLNGEIDKITALKEIISQIVKKEIKFPSIDSFINEFKINLDYYDVSDELLKTKDFDDFITEASIADKIRNYYSVHEISEN